MEAEYLLLTHFLGIGDAETWRKLANHLFKTTDRGDSWYLISPDLSKNEYHKTIKESGGLTADHGPGGGAEFFGTIITIAQSPVDAGVIWAGTDDGNVQITRDGGKNWMNVVDQITDLPSQDFWSRFSSGDCPLLITLTESPRNS